MGNPYVDDWACDYGLIDGGPYAEINGKRPIVIVEIDVDVVATELDATDPDTGAPCYKTPHTSGYWAPLTTTTRTLRFMTRSAPPIRGLYAVPSIESVSYQDDTLEVGRGFSANGQVSLTLVKYTGRLY